MGASAAAARFETDLTLSSPNHPDEEDGKIEVEAGSRIPGVPLHNLKLNLSTTIGRVSVGGNLHVEPISARRRSNLLPALDGFGVVNLGASYAIAPAVADCTGNESLRRRVLDVRAARRGRGSTRRRLFGPAIPQSCRAARGVGGPSVLIQVTS